MSNFLYLFRGGDESFNKLSQEEKQAHMEVWGKWMGELQEKGKLLDRVFISLKFFKYYQSLLICSISQSVIVYITLNKSENDFYSLYTIIII